MNGTQWLSSKCPYAAKVGALNAPRPPMQDPHR